MTAYIHLLSHLNRPSSSLPLDALNSAIAHHLATSPLSPTPLAAAVVSSPLFRVISPPKLQGLTTAFSHASHNKYNALQDDNGTIFTRSPDARFNDWVSAILKGLQGADPTIRLACSGGLLLALHVLDSSGDRFCRGHVEDEVVVCLAEIMDKYAEMKSTSIWEREFRAMSDSQEADVLSLALILASQSFPHVSAHRLKALPLMAFTHILVSAIDRTFASGTFLSSLSTSISVAQPSIHIPATSPFAQSIQALSASFLMSSIAPLSKMCSRSLSLLLESKPEQGIVAVTKTLLTLRTLTSTLEIHWATSPLSSTFTDVQKIDADTRELTEKTWTILKTLLFSTVMILDACLSTFTYIPGHIAQQPSGSSSDSLASSLAQTSLMTLSHLSFVISQFGGVSSSSDSGFVELKRVFFLALDILATDRQASEKFTCELCHLIGNAGSISDSISGENNLIHHAKKAYVLAIIEHLVPVISPHCIESYVVPLCLPHLSDAHHRDTYESSHSVVLTAFSSHAQQVGENFLNMDSSIQQGDGVNNNKKCIPLTFTDKLVPFYANCLIENSADGKLSTAQLRLAFSALVRSASASANVANIPTLADDRYALAWFCVDSLLRAIHSISQSAGSVEDRLHRLHLTLISSVPSLPLTLLPRILDHIHTIITSLSSGERKQELVQALFDEILERVGEREKEFAMRWWHDNRRALAESTLVSMPLPPETLPLPRL